MNTYQIFELARENGCNKLESIISYAKLVKEPEQLTSFEENILTHLWKDQQPTQVILDEDEEIDEGEDDSTTVPNLVKQIEKTKRKRRSYKKELLECEKRLVILEQENDHLRDLLQPPVIPEDATQRDKELARMNYSRQRLLVTNPEAYNAFQAIYDSLFEMVAPDSTIDLD